MRVFVQANMWVLSLKQAQGVWCVMDLGPQLLPLPPQARRQPLAAECLDLWFSEVLVKAVGPLAHGADVEPQRVCSYSSGSAPHPSSIQAQNPSNLRQVPDCSGALLMVNGCHSYLAISGMLM